jgi:hypothetical protein
LKPQQASVPSVRRPQLWLSPALTEPATAPGAAVAIDLPASPVGEAAAGAADASASTSASAAAAAAKDAQAESRNAVPPTASQRRQVPQPDLI